MDNSTLQQLLRAGAFPHPADNLILRETHISWVILCGDFAYKIKKPVNFGFLDFSTLALRRHFCEQELALNSRFAPELYLSVVAVTCEDDGLRFGGSGQVIDYAVKMRRFDETQLLDNIASRGGLDRSLVRALACEIARQQSLAPVCRPDPASQEPGSPATLLAAIEQNFRQIREYTIATAEYTALAEVEQWTQQAYRQLLPALTRRVNQGRVIDGHGDAHLGNIALIDGKVRLFDCIEFNPSLRIMDTVGELALLAMDLDARGHHGDSNSLLVDYLEYSGDYDALALLDLYRSYFAMVRAKVALLREPADSSDIEKSAAYTDFRRYLALAGSYRQPRQRFLAITHGVSGTGKSTVADKLAAAGGAIRIRSDVERKRLFGLAPEQRSKSSDEAQLYSSAMSRKTFAQLEKLAGDALQSGFAVIVDATFLHRRARDRFRALAERMALPFFVIDCIAAPEHLRQRLVERERGGLDASEAGIRVMESQLKVVQPLADVELTFRVEADSAEDADVLWGRLSGGLKSALQRIAAGGL